MKQESTDSSEPIDELVRNDADIQAMLMNIMLVNMGLLPHARVTAGWSLYKRVVFDKEVLQTMLSSMDALEQRKYKRKFRKESRKALKAMQQVRPRADGFMYSAEQALFLFLMEKIKNREVKQ